MRCGKELAGSAQSFSVPPPVTNTPPPPPQGPTVYRPGKPGGVKPWVWIVIVAIIAGLIALVLYFTGVFGSKSEETKAPDAAVTVEKIDISWDVEETLPTAFYTNATERLIKINLKAAEPTTVTVSVEIPEITEKETKTIDVTAAQKSYDFKPSFLRSAYGPLKEAQKKNLNLKVTRADGSVILEEGIPITVLSREDMVWVSEDGSSNYQYIAKWVTKDAPEVKDLVRVAAEYNDSICGMPAMVGYLGDETMVACQMASIFAAMQDYYKIRYIASTESYQTSNAQKIRLPEDIIIERSGLCIETTVLVAAALENLGMEPVIIIIPGHAWVAVKAYPGAPYYFHLETTMLDAPLADALAAGEDNWYLNGGSALSVVDIKKARGEGILPFGSTEGGAQDL